MNQELSWQLHGDYWILHDKGRPIALMEVFEYADQLGEDETNERRTEKPARTA